MHTHAVPHDWAEGRALAWHEACGGGGGGDGDRQLASSHWPAGQPQSASPSHIHETEMHRPALGLPLGHATSVPLHCGGGGGGGDRHEQVGHPAAFQ